MVVEPTLGWSYATLEALLVGRENKIGWVYQATLSLAISARGCRCDGLRVEALWGSLSEGKYLCMYTV